MELRRPRSTLFPCTTLFRAFTGTASRVGGVGMDTLARETLDRHRSAFSAVWDNAGEDRKSTRLNSSHANISYAVFCLKKKLHRRPPSDGVLLMVPSRQQLCS